MGHGLCNSFSKTIDLAKHAKEGTDDAQMIAKHAIAIWRQWTFEPSDLRGVGLQLQRLNFVIASKKPPAKTSVRDFTKVSCLLENYSGLIGSV